MAAAGVTAPAWVLGLWRAGKLRTDWPARLGRGPTLLRPRRPRVLVYGVSVGEVGAARGLIAAMSSGPDAWDVVVASMTDTGVARAEQLFGDTHPVVRWPYDLSFAVKRLLVRVRPDVLVLMELEVWPTCIEVCRDAGVPVVVANGRLSERSFRGYRRVRPLLRRAFAGLSAVGAQTDDDARRFTELGAHARRVRVLGSLKWDAAPQAPPGRELPPQAAALVTRLGLSLDRPVVVAGSTAPGEEAMLLDGWAGGDRAAQVVLVPRKPEWFEAAASEATRRGLTLGRWSRPRSVAEPTPQVWLLDTIGRLGDAYAAAAVAHARGAGGVGVVGRSFTGTLYGSDVIEPVGLGLPTVIGPHHRDFQAVVDALLHGDGVRVRAEPWPAVVELLSDPAAASALAGRGVQVVKQQRGAAARYAALVAEHVRGDRSDASDAADVPAR